PAPCAAAAAGAAAVGPWTRAPAFGYETWEPLCREHGSCLVPVIPTRRLTFWSAAPENGRSRAKRMDEKAADKSLAEIYRLDGDTLTVAFRNQWNDPRRPTDFEPRDGIGIYLLVRKKP